MLRTLIGSLALLVIPGGRLSADGPANLDANAALKYWRAFATMQKLTPEEEKQVRNYQTMPLDAKAREIVNKAEYSLRLMHDGAALQHCEWAIDWKDEGVDGLLPQMGAARTLTSIAGLRARMRFGEGKSREAVEDLVAAMTLGRHVSLDGSLIGVLVGYAIEARVTETLAVFLPKLDAMLLDDVRKRLDAIPAGSRPALALRQCEENTLDWLVHKVKGIKDKESLIAMLAWVGVYEGRDKDASGKARAFVEECGGTAEGVLRCVEDTRPSYAIVAKQLDMPVEEFAKAFDSESKKQANNPVFKVLFPAVAKVRESQARCEVRRALFRAALAIQRDGRDVLKDHPDPVVGGSFDYSPFEGGFELRSKMKTTDGKPLALTVGQRP